MRSAWPGAPRIRCRAAALSGFAWMVALAGLALAQPVPPSARPRPAPPAAPLPWEAPLARPPLDPPLRLSGSFGEARSNHFHAGLDLSTDERPGRPVHASLDARVLRVRASGVGYGRSVYLLAPDGRMLVYGHLDAFDEPLASYVDSVQRASGQYEQDLWPDSTRFRVRAGQRLGWSGRSGTGPPHLHFEIRRGDMAYNPLLAGLPIRDSIPPVLRRVTFDPLPGSAIARHEGAVTLDLETFSDTLRLFGEARAAVEVEDARANGRLTMAPYAVSMRTPDGATVECRFDSASWADGMSEADEVYDRGRTAPDGDHAIRLWAPAGYRPRPIHASAPLSVPAGLVRADTPGVVRWIRFEARDLSAYRTSRTLPVVAWTPPAAVRESLAAPGARWRRVREQCTRIAGAAFDRGRASLRLLALEPGHPLRERMGPWTLELPATAPFEPGEVAVGALAAPALHGELRVEGPTCALFPDLVPMRVPFTLRCPAPRADRALGIYRETADGWEWVGADVDSASGARLAQTRRAGRFALLRDGLAPRVRLVAPPRRAPAPPWPRWALEATLEDGGSGVAARDSYFRVDGTRVPSEWDPEVSTLRWTPLRPPARGRHRVEVVATDRAGNVRHASGSFVLD